MKVLILGLMGAGKSTLAYNIQKRYGIARLNIDEVCRNKDTGEYYTKEQQLEKLKQFEKDNAAWVMEGSQKYLYEKVVPDLVVYKGFSFGSRLEVYIALFQSQKVDRETD